MPKLMAYSLQEFIWNYLRFPQRKLRKEMYSSLASLATTTIIIQHTMPHSDSCILCLLPSTSFLPQNPCIQHKYFWETLHLPFKRKSSFPLRIPLFLYFLSAFFLQPFIVRVEGGKKENALRNKGTRGRKTISFSAPFSIKIWLYKKSCNKKNQVKNTRALHKEDSKSCGGVLQGCENNNVVMIVNKSGIKHIAI